MKKLITYFLILLFAIWVGLKIAIDPGYVFISYHKTSIEMTFWLFLLLAAILFTILYLLLNFFFTSRILPKRLQIWIHNRREQKAIRLTELGLLKLIAHSWRKAERYVIAASKASPLPLGNFLLGAYAAQKLNHYWKRDQYITRAAKCNVKSFFTVNLVQSRLQIDAQQYEQALATLRRLRDLKPRHRAVLNLLQDLYLKLHDYESLEKLIPALRRYHVLSKSEINSLEQITFINLTHQENIDLDALWQRLSKELHNNQEIILNYVEYLFQEKQNDQAEKILSDALNKNWQPKLLNPYGLLVSSNPIKQLNRAEKWLKKHPDDPQLLLCLGRLCKRQTLWGKAKQYLEQSSQIFQSRAALYELGQVMEAQNNSPQALEYYKQGARLV